MAGMCDVPTQPMILAMMIVLRNIFAIFKIWVDPFALSLSKGVPFFAKGFDRLNPNGLLNLFARCDQFGAELFFAHASLLGTDVLHV